MTCRKSEERVNHDDLSSDGGHAGRCAFDGQAERIVCRAIDGDLAILAKHGDYCTALGMGEAHIVDAEGQRRRAPAWAGC